MRHARRLDDLVAVELFVPAIAVSVHHAVEVGEVFGRMSPFAVGTVIVGHRPGRRILVVGAVEHIDP